MRTRITVLSWFTLLGGCTLDGRDRPGDGGQFGEESGAACRPQSEVPLAWDEASAVGVVPQDVLDLVDGSHGATLTWADATTTDLEVVASGAANPRFIDYEWETWGSNGGMEPAMTCADVVAIDVTLAVATADGQLAESWSHTLESATGGDVTTYVELDAVAGSFDALDWADATYDEVWADLALSFTAAGISGEIRGYGEKTEGTGPDGVVSLTMFDIATF